MISKQWALIEITTRYGVQTTFQPRCEIFSPSILDTEEEVKAGCDKHNLCWCENKPENRLCFARNRHLTCLPYMRISCTVVNVSVAPKQPPKIPAKRRSITKIRLSGMAMMHMALRARAIVTSTFGLKLLGKKVRKHIEWVWCGRPNSNDFFWQCGRTMGPLQLSDCGKNRQIGEQMTHWSLLNKENSNLVGCFI